MTAPPSTLPLFRRARAAMHAFRGRHAANPTSIYLGLDEWEELKAAAKSYGVASDVACASIYGMRVVRVAVPRHIGVA